MENTITISATIPTTMSMTALSESTDQPTHNPATPTRNHSKPPALASELVHGAACCTDSAPTTTSEPMPSASTATGANIASQGTAERYRRPVSAISAASRSGNTKPIHGDAM